MDNLEIRDATAADVPLLLSMILLLAEFEKLTVTSTEDSLRTALFGEPPLAHAVLAFAHGEPAGYATYFFTFASMSAQRGLWLDDLFIMPAFRGQGIGKALLASVAEIGARNHCGKMEWTVLDWNESAISFYKRLGARFLSNWQICRLDGEGLSNVVAQERSQ